MRPTGLLAIGLLLLTPVWSAVHAQAPSKPISPPDRSGARPPQVHKAEGISVEFTVEAISAEKRDRNALLAGTEAQVRFKILETTGGKPIQNVRPAAWIDRRTGG